MILRKKSNINIYDKLLILFIVLLAFGNIGDALQPIRIFILICVPVVMLLDRFKLVKEFKFESSFFILWLIYGIISMVWVFDVSAAIKEITYLFTYFIGFYAFIYFAKRAKNPKKSIIKGWILLFLIMLPIALVELFLDKHFAISVQEEGMVMNYGHGVIFDRHFASVTFGNLNGYNMILSYILPFIFGYLLFALNNKNYKNILFGLLLVISIIYLVISNSSRAAIGCLGINIFVFILYYTRNIKSLFIVIGISFVVIFLFIYYFSDIFTVFISRTQMQGLEDFSRWELIKNGLDALLNSYFLGVGAANFQHIMGSVYNMELTAAHNLFIEIIAQYGLIIFLLFVYELFMLYKKQKQISERNYKFIIIASLISFPLVTIINSGNLLNASLWLFLFSLFVISDIRFSKH